MIRAVIFDLDGTLTEPLLDFDAIREEIGFSRNAGPILELMKDLDAERQKEILRILDDHEKRAALQSTLNEGAFEILAWLRNHRLPIGILTRNTRENVLVVADRHGLEFDAIVDRTDGPVKPDSFGVLELCRRFGVRPEETLVVGDFLQDMLCGRAAGAITVLLKNHKDADSFLPYADHVIYRLDELIPIIENRGFME
jgi:HAD superfamily hydrolase (TIGR01509 family)